jgi:membrane-associated protease RseP (regulator of RpoE activity)
LVIEKNKPYIFAGVKIGESDKEIESKFLVDSGGSMALWLSAINNDKIYIPNKNIDSYLGKGLNGELHGKLSRISSINIGGYTHSKVLTAFPDSNSVEAAYLADHRVGSICGEILRRYTVTFNYPKLEMYLEQNSDFDDDFLFNNLGIEVYQPISGLNVYMISYIREGSIAESSGLKVDDRILSIDGYDLFKYNIKEIHGIIYELDDEDVEIEVKRDGKNIYFDFELGEGI